MGEVLGWPVMKTGAWVLTFGLIVLCESGMEARTWTSDDGRSLDAELVTATETSVTLKTKNNGKEFTLLLEKLSEEDQEYVAEELEIIKEREVAREKEELEKRIPRKNKKILQFALDRKGTKVGNGECWTLVNEAYKDTKVMRPGADPLVWGKELKLGEDEIFPGDVIQTVPKEKNGPSQHTALVMEVLGPGQFRVIEQNWGGKTVKQRITTHEKLTRRHNVSYYRPDKS